MDNILEKVDSIIFDLDGTLWDAVSTYTKAWNLYFLKHSLNYTLKKEFLDSLMGLEEEKYLAKAIPFIPVEKRKSVYTNVIDIQYQLINQEGGVIFDGVLDGLKTLSKFYKLFIVSNCPEFTIDYFIKWVKIEEYITDSIAHGANFRPKHENITYIKQKYKLNFPIYVGDTDSDRKQSELAEIPFVFMEYGFGKSDQFYKKYKHFNDFVNDFLKYKEEI